MNKGRIRGKTDEGIEDKTKKGIGGRKTRQNWRERMGDGKRSEKSEGKTRRRTENDKWCNKEGSKEKKQSVENIDKRRKE